jgi:hypothetical protein
LSTGCVLRSIVDPTIFSFNQVVMPIVGDYALSRQGLSPLKRGRYHN